MTLVNDNPQPVDLFEWRYMIFAIFGTVACASPSLSDERAIAFMVCLIGSKTRLVVVEFLFKPVAGKQNQVEL